MYLILTSILKFCEACAMGKNDCVTFPINEECKRSKVPSEFYHAYVCIMNVLYLGGEKTLCVFQR
jgi:hypothetical protein